MRIIFISWKLIYLFIYFSVSIFIFLIRKKRNCFPALSSRFSIFSPPLCLDSASSQLIRLKRVIQVEFQHFLIEMAQRIFCYSFYLLFSFCFVPIVGQPKCFVQYTLNLKTKSLLNWKSFKNISSENQLEKNEESKNSFLTWRKIYISKIKIQWRTKGIRKLFWKFHFL